MDFFKILPTEILEIILSQDNHTLLKARQVCRRWKEITQNKWIYLLLETPITSIEVSHYLQSFPERLTFIIIYDRNYLVRTYVQQADHQYMAHEQELNIVPGIMMYEQCQLCPDEVKFPYYPADIICYDIFTQYRLYQRRLSSLGLEATDIIKKKLLLQLNKPDTSFFSIVDQIKWYIFLSGQLRALAPYLSPYPNFSIGINDNQFTPLPMLIGAHRLVPLTPSQAYHIVDKMMNDCTQMENDIKKILQSLT
jgi:hypothetical protein